MAYVSRFVWPGRGPQWDKLFKAVAHVESGRRDMVPLMVQQSLVGCDPGGPSKESRLCQPHSQCSREMMHGTSTDVLIIRREFCAPCPSAWRGCGTGLAQILARPVRRGRLFAGTPF